MAIDLYLGGQSHDIETLDNDLLLIRDAPEVAQAVKIRLRFILGEWAFAFWLGVDLYGNLFNPATSIEQKEAELKNTILNTPGVESLLDFTFGVDPVERKAIVTYRADTIYEPIEDEVKI